MRLFWEEQQKYIQSSPNNFKYHTMIIRYCLSLASKSEAAYDDIYIYIYIYIYSVMIGLDL